MALRRVRILPAPASVPHARAKYACVNNKPPRDWDLGYEVVVSFHYGLDEDVIARIAGLRNYDTGITLATGVRDLMFPCGTDKRLALSAASRLYRADHFGALRIRISYPVEREGADAYTPWHNWQGQLVERSKHRKLHVVSSKSRKTKYGRSRTIKYKTA